MFKFVHRRPAHDVACDTHVARKERETREVVGDMCPPAILDASAGHTEEDIQEAQDRIQLQEWALEARFGTICPRLEVLLDREMLGWRDL